MSDSVAIQSAVQARDSASSSAVWGFGPTSIAACWEFIGNSWGDLAFILGVACASTCQPDDPSPARRFLQLTRFALKRLCILVAHETPPDRSTYTLVVPSYALGTASYIRLGN